MAALPNSFRIDRLGARGDGVARHDGRDIFIPFALPGETVTAEVGGDRGRLISVEAPSPNRIAPICRHFGACGGCALQHFEPAAYRTWKRGLVVEALKDRGIGFPVGDLVTMPLHSRRRAVFAATKTNGEVELGFHAARDTAIIDLAECPVLEPAITSRMPALRKLVGAAIAAGVEAKATVTVLDHGLDVAIENSGAPQGQKRFAELAAIVAQHGGIARISVDGETVLRAGLPVLTLDGVVIEPPPGGFLQAVAAAETFIAGRICEALSKLPRKARVADFYSGAGVFAFAAAKHLQVDAYEIEQSAVDALTKAAAAAKGRRPIAAFRSRH